MGSTHRLSITSPNQTMFQGPIRLNLLRFTDRSGVERSAMDSHETYLTICSFPSGTSLGAGLYKQGASLHLVELEACEIDSQKFQFRLLKNGQRSPNEPVPVLDLRTEEGRITRAILMRPGSPFLAHFINGDQPKFIQNTLRVDEILDDKPEEAERITMEDLIEEAPGKSATLGGLRRAPTALDIMEREHTQDSIEDLIDELDECERFSLEGMLKQGFKKFKRFKVVQQIINKKKQLWGESELTKPVAARDLRASLRKWKRHYSRRQKFVAKKDGKAATDRDENWGEVQYF